MAPVVAGAMAVLYAGPVLADPISIPINDTDPALGVVNALATVLDPLMTNLAVTDSELLTVGMESDNSSPTADDPQTIVVGDGVHPCPNAIFTGPTSIQQAILFAHANPAVNRIRACPGSYAGPVAIDIPLTLQATRNGQASECFQAPEPANPSEEAIIESASVTGTVNITANDVVLDGFTVQGNTAGEGIYTSPSYSGYRILHNVVQNNVFGLYFNASGSEQSLVRQNCFRNNNQAGAASGNGIYSDQGLQNGLIASNLFTGDTNASVILTNTGAPTSNITISHNNILNDSSIALFRGSEITVDHNRSINPSGSAIFAGGVSGALIAYNILQGNATSGNGISLRTDVGFPTPDNQNIVVTKNKVTGFPNNGIRLGAGTHDNTVSRNVSHSNLLDGIFVTDLASNNTIRENHMRDNKRYDCEDVTAGTGTAGTANFWTENHGHTENRPGLCRHQSDDD
jgi:parallel beta-helix repeat protein